MSMTARSQNYFEKVAQHWDSLRQGYFTEEVRQAALQRGYLRPDMVAADIGGGTGFISSGLAPLVQKVHLIDGSKAMIEVARQNLQNFDNIEYHLTDGLSIPLPDHSMDVVFANMVLHHCSDPLAAIQEWARLLRPGGRLIITDQDSHNHTWQMEEMADEWLGFERSQLRRWFQEAGLVNILVESTGQTCCAQSQNTSMVSEDGQQSQVSIFVAVGTKSVQDVHNHVQSSYGALAREGGCCGQSDQNASCCGAQDTGNSSCCQEQVDSNPFQPEFTADELSNLPPEAAEFSLGCGNPVALANLKPGEVVLDIGSGGGLDCFLAARRVGPTGKVIGVDMTQDMLDRANRALKKTGLNNVSFRLGFAENLPIEDDSVDVVLSNCVLNLTEDKGRAFQEAFRVLRNNGRLEVSDIVSDRSLPSPVSADAAQWAGCIAGALPEGEYLSLIAQAGFRNIVVKKKVFAGEDENTKIYSITVSAVKHPATATHNSSCCGGQCE
ncbi:MAG: arsenite methyltransferase [Anaerolineae bacterium]|nr:arsenite methyltransferase [Anaerolineae bacterium]